MSFSKPVKKGISPVLVILLLAVVVTGVIAAVIFTQTVPVVTPSPGAVSTGSCGLSLVLVSPAPLAGSTSPGALLFGCALPPTATSQALNILSSSVATISFTLPAQYSGLYILAHTTSTTCAVAGPGITSGTIPTLPAGAYDYCVSYPSVPATGTLPSFTITWSQ